MEVYSSNQRKHGKKESLGDDSSGRGSVSPWKGSDASARDAWLSQCWLKA